MGNIVPNRKEENWLLFAYSIEKRFFFKENKVRTIATLLCIVALLIAVPTNAGELGIEFTINNDSFKDLKSIDWEYLEGANVSQDTSQQVRAFGSFELKNFYFGADASFLSPQVLNFNEMFEYWLGYAYAGIYLYDSKPFDCYLQLTARESSDNVQGYEDLFGTLGGTVGVKWKF